MTDGYEAIYRRMLAGTGLEPVPTAGDDVAVIPAARLEERRDRTSVLASGGR